MSALLLLLLIITSCTFHAAVGELPSFVSTPFKIKI